MASRFARTLRKTAPANERKLWALLRDRRLDRLKFRRQVPVGKYVADFLCHRHRLIVELDGPFHDAARDAERDAWLANAGYHVLRFSNTAIGTGRETVLAAILQAVEAPGPGPD
jgi:very-short-patch-repair endonuclease